MDSGLFTTILVFITVTIGTALWAAIQIGGPLALGIACVVMGVAVVPFIARKDEEWLRERERREAKETGQSHPQRRPGPRLEPPHGREPQNLSRVSARPVRALIIGAGDVGRALAEKLEADRRYQVVGFIDDPRRASPCDGDWPILGPRWAAAEIMRDYAVDEVFLAYAPTWQEELAEELARSGSEVRVQVVPSYFDSLLSNNRIRSIGDVAVVPMAHPDRQTAYDRVKRVVDFWLAAGGLVAFFPVMALIGLIIRATSPGPALFTQERVGYRGRRFLLYKFRTMHRDAEAETGPVLSAGKDDERLTPIGRWMRLLRLDELPQLINVVRGEMSIVGPRPERTCFVERFTERDPVYARRHEVRPGITGLAQVHGGYHTDARDKLRFDLFYVSHRSVLLDVSILWQTFLLMMTRPNGR